MTSAVVQHRGGAVAVADAVGSSSRSSAGISWTATAATWADHTILEAPHAGALAGTIVALPGVRTTGPHSGLQTRLGFRCYIDRIVVATFERELTRGSDGRYRPSSSWTNFAVIHTAVTAPVRTKGLVAAGRLDAAGLIGEPGAPAASREFESALSAETFLPGPVRASLCAVAAPEVHIGTFLLLGEGKAAEQNIVVLRLGAGSAAAVQATRADNASAPWAVNQWAYQIETDRRQIGR